MKHLASFWPTCKDLFILPTPSFTQYNISEYSHILYILLVPMEISNKPSH